ncbi:MAG: hypothetical protein VR65_20025 [Desulfobulbaceae bacterium BRH_c16a]|nr:MAG: hypothetical protein VR65_20025 [Desulfobulbaceae bacterium BRH_c16a]
MAALQFQLDYPSVNCKQCRKNLEEDEIEPECDGQGWPSVAGARDGTGATGCPVNGWDMLTRQLLALHDRVCPWGELIMSAVPQAMDDLEIAPGDRRLARRCLVSIHRTIKHYHQQRPATA